MATTFGQVKAELALSVDNGVTSSDTRVMALTNTAQRALMEAMPRGIFVGGVMQVTISITNTNQIALPSSMDVALEVESTDPTNTALNGWYNITNPSTLVDPDDIMDTALVDLGFVSGLRTYAIPELPVGTTSVVVWGLKQFVPVAGDSDVLIVPNVLALRHMLMFLDKSLRFDQEDAAEKYRAMAVKDLMDELARALMDPTRYASRYARWKLEESSYAIGTLGNARARIALDMVNGQNTGRGRINRLVSRAIAWVYQRRYEYQLNARNRIKTSVPTIAATPTDPTTVLNPPIQYEVIRQVVQALMAEDHQGTDEDRGTGRLTPGAELVVSQKFGQEIQAQLTQTWDAELEQLRHTTYATTLQTLISASSFTLLGYVTAKYALETVDGLKLSDVELNRMANEAAREAVNMQNALGKLDRYSNAAGPNTVTFTYAQASSDALSFTDYEVLKLLMQAQLPSYLAADADKLKGDALEIIERNLAQQIDAARSTARYARLSLGPTTIGYLSARLGLEMPPELAISDEKLYRLINEGAREALQQRDWLGRTERYSNLDGPESILFVAAAVDTDVVSYPDLEVQRRMVKAQIVEGADSQTARADALALIERNLQKSIESARFTRWECLMQNYPYPLFGGTRAQIGLEIAAGFGEEGYKISDQYVGRLLNEAEEYLNNKGHWKRSEGEYQLAVTTDGIVTMPADVESVLYAERCGVPVELRGRKWRYTGWPTRIANGGWLGWLGGCYMTLVYEGTDDDGNCVYLLNNGCPGPAPVTALRALCQRKWVKKVDDDDVMLVQSLPALRDMVLAIIDKSKGDYAGYALKKNAAVAALDDALNQDEEANLAHITVRIPGQRWGLRRRYSGVGYGTGGW